MCKILAREMVGSRRAVSKLYASKAQINSVCMQMKTQASMVKMSEGFQASADIMKLMNKLTKVNKQSILYLYISILYSCIFEPTKIKLYGFPQHILVLPSFTHF